VKLRAFRGAESRTVRSGIDARINLPDEFQELALVQDLHAEFFCFLVLRTRFAAGDHIVGVFGDR